MANFRLRFDIFDSKNFEFQKTYISVFRAFTMAFLKIRQKDHYISKPYEIPRQMSPYLVGLLHSRSLENSLQHRRIKTTAL